MGRNHLLHLKQCKSIRLRKSDIWGIKGVNFLQNIWWLCQNKTLVWTGVHFILYNWHCRQIHIGWFQELSLVVFSSSSILLQLSPKNLSGSRLWNRFEEADPAQRLLVLRKPLPHVLKNLEREFVGSFLCSRIERWMNLTNAHLTIAE